MYFCRRGGGLLALLIAFLSHPLKMAVREGKGTEREQFHLGLHPAQAQSRDAQKLPCWCPLSPQTPSRALTPHPAVGPLDSLCRWPSLCESWLSLGCTSELPQLTLDNTGQMYFQIMQSGVAIQDSAQVPLWALGGEKSTPRQGGRRLGIAGERAELLRSTLLYQQEDFYFEIL